MYSGRKWALLALLAAGIGFSSCEALTEVSKIKDGLSQHQLRGLDGRIFQLYPQAFNIKE